MHISSISPQADLPWMEKEAVALAARLGVPETEARETLAIKYQGKDLAIAFNPAYLLDPLKALDEDEVAFELIDELSPGVVKTAKPFLYVIMPMRMT